MFSYIWVGGCCGSARLRCPPPPVVAEQGVLLEVDVHRGGVVQLASLLSNPIPSCLWLFSERQWNMWIPGFGSDEIRPFKKACTTEAHKQVRASPESPAPGPPQAALTFGGGLFSENGADPQDDQKVARLQRMKLRPLCVLLCVLMELVDK